MKLAIRLLPIAAVMAAALITPQTASTNEYVLLVPNSGPQHASSFTLNLDGSFTYVPVQNYYGSDSFQFEVVDSNGRTAAADDEGTHVQDGRRGHEWGSVMSASSERLAGAMQ